MPFKPNFDSDVCENNIPGSQKFAENIIQTLDKTQPDTLGKSTVKTKGCDQYPGGKDGLLKEMQEAVNIGTECLIGKSPESKLEAVKLLAIFDNPKTQVNLFCGSTDQEIKLSDGDTEKLGSNTIARALVPPRDQSPGMMINLNNMDKDANERKRTLFHEMLHWLGILHSESFETPYISEICCIPEEKDSPKTKKACDLLSLSPRPELDSKAYLNAFTDLMMLDYRSFIAMDQISKTTLEKVQKPPINLSAEFEASQKLREYGNLNSKVHVEVLKKLDPSLKESAGFIKDETPIGKAATFTGDLVVLMVEKKSYKEFVKSASAIKQNYKALLTECKTEEEKTELRENIQSWLDHYSLLSFDVPDPMELNQKYAYQIWENLAKDL